MPPFAGFFSKDEILWQAFSSSHGHILLWAAGAIGATLTAFYMTRLMALTFWGESRVDKHVHPHESPLIMTIPLMVLALLSVIGGWVGVPHVLGESLGHIPNFWEHWLAPVIRKLPDAAHASHPASLEIGLMVFSVALAAISASVAYVMYTKKSGASEKVAQTFGPVYKLVEGKYFVDEFYFKWIINPLVDVSKSIWHHIDVNLIDKMTFVVTDITKNGGSIVRTLQSGNMQQYAMYVMFGVVMALTFLFLR
jgi:NADH-quinone oxidoreductase subunit L